MVPWLAARTRSRYEKLVAGQLTRRGIENYLPLVKEKRRDGPVELVLIPGYVFLVTDRPGNILTIVGVCGFVTFQKAPAQIPQEEIDMLKNSTVPRYRAKEYSGYVLRQAVRVVGTPFDGLVGTVDQALGRRVRVILPTSIGKSISVELQVENVEPLPAHGIVPPLMIEVPSGVH